MRFQDCNFFLQRNATRSCGEDSGTGGTCPALEIYSVTQNSIKMHITTFFTQKKIRKNSSQSPSLLGQGQPYPRPTQVYSLHPDSGYTTGWKRYLTLWNYTQSNRRTVPRGRPRGCRQPAGKRRRLRRWTPASVRPSRRHNGARTSHGKCRSRGGRWASASASSCPAAPAWGRSDRKWRHRRRPTRPRRWSRGCVGRAGKTRTLDSCSALLHIRSHGQYNLTSHFYF